MLSVEKELRSKSVDRFSAAANKPVPGQTSKVSPICSQVENVLRMAICKSSVLIGLEFLFKFRVFGYMSLKCWHRSICCAFTMENSEMAR